jgi:hypothetical protein
MRGPASTSHEIGGNPGSPHVFSAFVRSYCSVLEAYPWRVLDLRDAASMRLDDLAFGHLHQSFHGRD